MWGSLELPDLEHTTIFINVGSSSNNNKASQRRRFESSATSYFIIHVIQTYIEEEVNIHAF